MKSGMTILLSEDDHDDIVLVYICWTEGVTEEARVFDPLHLLRPLPGSFFI